jgi:hypothetical protein
MKEPQTNQADLDPSRFPITFEEMLRLLMPQVDKANDRVARFRRYLIAWETPEGQPAPPDALSKAAALIEQYKERGCTNHYFFYSEMRPNFRAWWERELSTKRREAAKPPEPPNTTPEKKPKRKPRKKGR